MPAVEFADLLGIDAAARRGPTRPLQVFCCRSSAGSPTSASKIDADGWRFEIVDLDGRRIDKVLAAKIG